jgi:hypothetical protein
MQASGSETWSQPWNIGDWSQLELNSFDRTPLLEKQRSREPLCRAPLGSLGPTQSEARVVPCGACPQGYEFDAKREALQCRPEPLCTAEKCTTCQVQQSMPHVTGSCDACVEYGCDPNSNRCSCN